MADDTIIRVSVGSRTLEFHHTHSRDIRVWANPDYGITISKSGDGNYYAQVDMTNQEYRCEPIGTGAWCRPQLAVEALLVSIQEHIEYQQRMLNRILAGK